MNDIPEDTVHPFCHKLRDENNALRVRNGKLRAAIETVIENARTHALLSGESVQRRLTKALRDDA